jgi:hypothetical protein
MKIKYTLLISFVLLAQAVAACGTATPIAPVSEPTAAPPVPTATPEPVDPAAIAQEFYKATNAGNLDAAMALVAEDVQCRGGCYITGKQSFQTWIQGSINRGGRVEISDLKVEGDKVTYNWEAFSEDGFFQARGVETLQIKDGLIVLMESIAQ